MNKKFLFDYDIMFDFYDTNPYRQNVDEDGQVVCFAYERINQSMKFQTKRKRKESGPLRSFLHRSVSHVTRLKDMEEVVPFKDLGHGFYVVAFQDKRSLYFVSPVIKDLSLVEKAWFADHFSFIVDPSDAKTPLHLHKTTYLPEPLAGVGFCSHITLFIPERIDFTVPVSISNFAKQYFANEHQAYAKYVLPLMLEPYRRNADLLVEGGGPSTTTKASRMRNEEKEREREREREEERPRHESFTNLWLNKPITEILVFGIRQPDGRYLFNVFCEDDIDRDDDENRVAASFMVGSRSIARNERIIQSKIATALEHTTFRRNEFVDDGDGDDE